MSLYSPAGSNAADYGLSQDAQLLTPARLESEVLIAEQVLGVIGTAFTDDDAELAKALVARQVNLQVRLSLDGSDVASETRGHRTITYATVGGQRVPVDALAMAGIRGLLAPLRSSVSEAVFRW